MANEILPFGLGVESNVMTQAEYEALAARSGGFSSGVAKSEQLNKVWRQSSFIASVLADFIATQSGDDVLDNGNTATLLASLELAIKKYANSNLPIASTSKQGITQLSSSINSSSETLAATLKAVKTVSDAGLKVTGNLAEIKAAGPAAVAEAQANLNLAELLGDVLQKKNNLSEIAAAGSAAQSAAQANIGVTGGLGAGVIGRLIAKRSITSTGVIPKATGAKWAIIRAWSAGGGGGGAGRTVTAGNASQGWAGQSGSFIELLVDVSGLSNYDCSIGLGGTGGAVSNVNAGNPGLDGGSTIIAGILSCPGGKGGQPGVLGTTNNTGIAIVGTALPTATLGTILDSSVSDIGAPGAQVGTGPNQSLGCRGGSAPGGLGSVGGQAGRPVDAGTDGTGGDGKGHAAGGGGGSSVSNTTGYGGGNGTGGFISITEFA
ncbi:tail fiber protein [Yersinia enterocolitica]|uniref:tail fiber protein n=1 Tax=Yersinia enterocolitica TaxID=630 RepID=UPI002AC72A53|nr:tail fiber protein [Yersinia enterocolitica]